MKSRFNVTLFLVLALLINGVWHVAHAEFHSSADVAMDQMPLANSGGDVDHGGDTLVHPQHQQAYLYLVELVPPPARIDRVVDTYLNRFVSGHAARLFRPPAL